MIDLTPLDVRKKKGDFRRGMRGYDADEVDQFLDLVAERMEELLRENVTLRERSAHLVDAVEVFRSREQALNEALVSAQQIREQMREQSAREAELTMREARAEGARMVDEAKRLVEQEQELLHKVRLQRSRFLRAYRAFLESQIAEIALEEERRGRPAAAAEAPASTQGGDD